MDRDAIRAWKRGHEIAQVVSAVADRSRDHADLVGQLEREQGIARGRLRSLVEDAAAVIEAPELVDALERLLTAVPAR
jgi:hypothetical protein